MKIAIIKYNAGNVQSVRFALERLGEEAEWTDDPVVLRRAERVIFPGVGEASTAMHYLRERGLDKVIAGLGQPVLGICLGLQLFCRHTEEGNTDCLGIFDVDVRKFDPAGALPSYALDASAGRKVPHMGWNTLEQLRGPLFKGVEENSSCYFVHSFYAETGPESAALTQYGVPFSAAMQRDNFFAVQFHAEKSGLTGQRILENFLLNT